jgi:hypothetical protein
MANVTNSSILPDRDLPDLTMHIQADECTSHRPTSQLDTDRFSETGGRTTPTDPRSKGSRASRRGGQVITRARTATCESGLANRGRSRMDRGLEHLSLSPAGACE